MDGMRMTHSHGRVGMGPMTGVHQHGMGSGKYQLQVDSSPRPPMPGQPALLTLKVTDKAGRVVKDFDTEMQRKMHLAVFSSSLGEFKHVHPKLQPDGTWKLKTTFHQMEHYQLV